VTAASNDFNFKRWSMMKNIKKFAKASFCVSPLTVNISFSLYEENNYDQNCKGNLLSMQNCIA
jgi:hypothetical protein